MNTNTNQGQNKQRVYWRKNQVYLKFPFKVQFGEANSTVNQLVTSHLTTLNATLKESGLALAPLTQQGTSQAIPAPEATTGEPLLNGVYVFPLPPPPINSGALRESEVAGVFQIVPASPTNQPPSATPDSTLTVVAHINKTNQASTSPTPAIPNMLWTASFGGPDIDQTHGGPGGPPIPVETLAAQWHITMPAIPQGLQNVTGKGVTVFVLDTLPEQQQMLNAAKGAGNNNGLLQNLIENMYPNIDSLSDADAANPQQLVVTGNDINGNLAGFPMADHGMFVAGIVHDLAPSAKIECIRVLDNYGIGDVAILTNALQSIQQRMYEGGNLYQNPVVINLSLLVMPPENDMPPDFTPEISQMTRSALHDMLQQLIDSGAIIVAAAGNDSNPRDPLNPEGARYWPRYPARFAFDTQFPLPDIISVGAVNGQGQPASYSNYPGPQGIATYGGEIPTVLSQGNTTGFTIAMPPDALRGVYTSPSYPQLAPNASTPPSPETYPEYAAPNPYAWAYWYGTSFAAPVISALAARALENQQALKGQAVRETISAGAPQVSWKNLKNEGNQATGTGSTPVIQATQPA